MGNFFYSCILGFINFFFPPSTPPPAPHTVTPPALQETSDRGGSIGEQFAPYLVQRHNDSLKQYDPRHLKKVRYYAFYFSASWCPPCRAFTPKLVTFYNHFKKTHPNFELIFICEDRSEGDMQSYMNEDGMPWPAVGFDSIQTASLGLNRFVAPYIPDLVLTDSDGKILSNTMVYGSYQGPEHVLDDIGSMVPAKPQ